LNKNIIVLFSVLTICITSCSSPVYKPIVRNLIIPDKGEVAVSGNYNLNGIHGSLAVSPIKGVFLGGSIYGDDNYISKSVIVGYQYLKENENNLFYGCYGVAEYDKINARRTRQFISLRDTLLVKGYSNSFVFGGVIGQTISKEYKSALTLRAGLRRAQYNINSIELISGDPNHHEEIKNLDKTSIWELNFQFIGKIYGISIGAGLNRRLSKSNQDLISPLQLSMGLGYSFDLKRKSEKKIGKPK
jgi:hypothetical protein